MATRAVGVPIVGYPMESGLSLALVCVATGKTLPLAAANTHEEWVERTLWLPRSFCPSEVRAVALSASPTFYVGLGTPVESSLLSWLKESVFVLVAIHAVCAGLLLLPALAAARLLRMDVEDVRTWALWTLPGVLIM